MNRWYPSGMNFRDTLPFSLLLVLLITLGLSCSREPSARFRESSLLIDSLNNILGKDILFRQSRIDTIGMLIRLSDSIGYPEGTVKTAITGARMYMSEFRNDKALEMLDLAQKSVGKADDPRLAALVAFNYGKFNFRITNFDAALDFFLKSSELALEGGDSSLYSKSLMNIGNTYFESGNMDMARKYFSKAILIDRLTGNIENLLLSYHQMSLYYHKTGQRDSSIYFLERELNTSKGSRNLMLYLYNLNNLLSLQIDEGKYDLARQTADEAMRLYDSIKGDYPPNPARSAILANLGTLSEKRGEFREALRLYNLALTDSIHVISPDFRIKLLEAVYSLHRLLGDPEKAWPYLDRYLVLKDSITRQKNRQNLMALEMKYNYTKLQKELKNKQQKLVGSAVLFAAIIIILVLLFQRQRMKTRNIRLESRLHEEEVNRLNRELASHALNLVRDNERKVALIDQIKGHIESAGNDTRQILRQILKGLDPGQDDTLWKEFDLRFNAVHSDFYQRLSAINPNLTPNEKRLCAFLLLGMTTKEISSITGQSIRAIEQGRFRLRKQLGLVNQDQNLSSFLSSLQ